ncbi:MAG: EamA family transporter [Actinomycetota bacterium]|nr:EamA family transporter [Actinomycetota bacterium]
MARPAPPAWRIWTALGLVYVLWGSTYLAIRYVVATVPPLAGAAIRFLVAAALLAGYLALRRGRRAFAVRRRQLVSAAGVGVLLLLAGNGGVTIAEQHHLPSGMAALLVAGVPLYVVLLRWSARDRPSRSTLIGVAIGFLGLAVLLLPGARPSGIPLGPAVLVLCSSSLWAVGSFVATRVDLPADPLWSTSLQMLGGGAALAVASAVAGERLHPAAVSRSSLLAVGYLVVFGSIVAFTSYSWLLQVAPVSKVATYAYVNPVVAVLLGAVVVGEHVTALQLVGGGVTVVAVAVVVSGEGRRQVAGPIDAPLAVTGQGPEERQARDLSSST